MNDLPNASFVCSGQNALELSSAICCAGKLIRLLKDEGFSVAGCYSCISPGDKISLTAKKLRHMCSVCDLVITVGCEGFRPCDIMPDITRAIADKDASFFTGVLDAGEVNDVKSGQSQQVFPSRAFAGFCSGALIMNLSCDVQASAKKLSALLPSVRYAISHSKGKTAVKSKSAEELIAEFFS